MMHRVTEIQELSSVSNWRFCPGKETQQTYCTKDAREVSLCNNCKWWNGPSFLFESTENWTTVADEELVKALPTTVHSLVAVPQEAVALNIAEVIDISRYCNLNKLLRVTALVLKFVDLCKRITLVTKGLMVSDIIKAEEIWGNIRSCV